MTFGEKLKNVRIKNGYSIQQCGNLCNIRPSRLRDYENDIMVPRHAVLKRLSSALHISWYYLISPDCTDPSLGVYTQNAADYIWDLYGKSDALRFQKINVNAEIIFEVSRVRQSDRLNTYRYLFDSYCESKTDKKDISCKKKRGA